MRLEILGSGGACPPPRPGCFCRICTEARRAGVPYYRTGPSYFLHDANLLFDTPEESVYQINRSGIRRIEAGFYSHWHPDHTMGRRLWESLHASYRTWPPEPAGSDIFLPPLVADDFEVQLGLKEHFDFMSERRWTRLRPLAPGATVVFGDITITPFPVAESYVYAFLIEERGKRILLAPDELLGWTPPDFARGVDVAVLPMGICEFHPFTGARQIAIEHPILKSEATFSQTLEIVRALDAGEVILSHIEEGDGLSHDDLARLSMQLQSEGLPVSFAWDMRVVEVI